MAGQLCVHEATSLSLLYVNHRLYYESKLMSGAWVSTQRDICIQTSLLWDTPFSVRRSKKTCLLTKSNSVYVIFCINQTHWLFPTSWLCFVHDNDVAGMHEVVYILLVNASPPEKDTLLENIFLIVWEVNKRKYINQFWFYLSTSKYFVLLHFDWIMTSIRHSILYLFHILHIWGVID